MVDGFRWENRFGWNGILEQTCRCNGKLMASWGENYVGNDFEGWVVVDLDVGLEVVSGRGLCVGFWMQGVGLRRVAAPNQLIARLGINHAVQDRWIVRVGYSMIKLCLGEVLREYQCTDRFRRV